MRHWLVVGDRNDDRSKLNFPIILAARGSGKAAYEENLFRAMPEIVIGNVIMLTFHTRSFVVETANCI